MRVVVAATSVCEADSGAHLALAAGAVLDRQASSESCLLLLRLPVQVPDILSIPPVIPVGRLSSRKGSASTNSSITCRRRTATLSSSRQQKQPCKATSISVSLLSVVVLANGSGDGRTNRNGRCRRHRRGGSSNPKPCHITQHPHT